jgi:Flp pilus assembly protein TadD
MKDTPTARAARRQQWLEQIDGALRSYGMAAAGQLALQALADGVEHPAVLNLAASVRYGEGRIDEAASLLKRARSLAPKDAHILNSLGVCLKALGDTDGALRAYEAATRADPGLAAAHFNRGSILEERSDISGARLAYERATALDPNYVEPLAGLAWLDAQAGDTDSARSRTHRALTL